MTQEGLNLATSLLLTYRYSFYLDGSGAGATGMDSLLTWFFVAKSSSRVSSLRPVLADDAWLDQSVVAAAAVKVFASPLTPGLGF